MEEISKFFDTLYSHFVIRDIAAKVLPGLLALFSIVKIFRPDISYTSGLLVDIPDVFKAVVLYGVGFVSGVLLQYVGMKSGLTITHVWPKTEANTSEFNSVDRAISFLVEVDSKHPLARKRERMIVLKEMTGNYALALIVLAVSSLIIAATSEETHLYISIACASAVVAVLLIFQNRGLAREQKIWEEEATRRFKGESSA